VKRLNVDRFLQGATALTVCLLAYQLPRTLAAIECAIQCNCVTCSCKVPAPGLVANCTKWDPFQHTAYACVPFDMGGVAIADGTLTVDQSSCILCSPLCDTCTRRTARPEDCGGCDMCGAPVSVQRFKCGEDMIGKLDSEGDDANSQSGGDPTYIAPPS
jgi:hypothetical protein